MARNGKSNSRSRKGSKKSTQKANKRTQYTQEQKTEALEMMMRDGAPKTAEALHINIKTLYGWKNASKTSVSADADVIDNDESVEYTENAIENVEDAKDEPTLASEEIADGEQDLATDEPAVEEHESAAENAMEEPVVDAVTASDDKEEPSDAPAEELPDALKDPSKDIQKASRGIRYSQAQKQAALDMMEREGTTKTLEALHISAGTLYRWKSEAKTEKPQPVDDEPIAGEQISVEQVVAEIAPSADELPTANQVTDVPVGASIEAEEPEASPTEAMEIEEASPVNAPIEVVSQEAASESLAQSDDKHLAEENNRLVQEIAHLREMNEMLKEAVRALTAAITK